MNVGINWIALVLLVGVFAVLQIRSLSLRLRYFIAAALYVLIGLSVFRGGGASKINLVIAALAFFFAVRYLFNGMRSRSR